MELNLDWKSIAGTVAPYAPTIGRVLGAGFGSLGSTIGGIAGDALASIFGTEATPEAVGKAIAQDPDAASKLQQLEADRGQEILAQAQVKIEELKQQTEQFRISADDTQNARQFTAQLVASSSPLAWGASVLAVVYTTAFLVVLSVAMTNKIEENQILLVLLGSLTAGQTMILGYFFGSSVGSKNNADRFANLASAVADKPNPSPSVVAAIQAAKKK